MFTIFDVGLLNWVSSFTSKNAPPLASNNYSYCFQKAGDATLARNAPYFAIVLAGGYYNSGFQIETSSFFKNLPEATAELWSGFDAITQAGAGTLSTGTSTAPYRLIDYQDAAGNSLVSLRLWGYNSASPCQVDVYVGATNVGTIGGATSILTNLELYAKIDASAGAVKVYKDGLEVFSWTGNTGSANISRVGCYNQAVTKTYYSNMVFSNEARVGNKVPLFSALYGAGATSQADYMDFVGNVVGGSGTNHAVSVTISPVDRFPTAGTITAIKLKLGVVGTFKVGVVTYNGSNNLIRTVKYMSDTITATATGDQSLIAGTHFPANWTVDANDSIAFFGITAQLTYSAASLTAASDGYNCGMLTYSGDGINTGDATAKTYTAAATTNNYLLAADYLSSVPAAAYALGSNPAKLVVDGLNAGIPNIMNNRYFVCDAVDENDLFTITGISDPALLIKKVKITTLASAGDLLTTADLLLNINSTNNSTNVTLPTNKAAVDGYISGSWTAAQYNAAQIGFKAKA